MSERPKEITPADFLGELQGWANKVDVERARLDQKDPDRVAFIQAVTDNLALYNSEPSRKAKGADSSPEYLNAIKQVLHSRTTELFSLIEACRTGDSAAFGSITDALHLAALKLLGKDAPKEVVTSADHQLRLNKGDYPAALARGFGSSLGGIIESGRRDVQREAANKSRRKYGAI